MNVPLCDAAGGVPEQRRDRHLREPEFGADVSVV
jgi:hypothetical protein